jgi:hypothetical protein
MEELYRQDRPTHGHIVSKKIRLCKFFDDNRKRIWNAAIFGRGSAIISGTSGGGCQWYLPRRCVDNLREGA